MSSPWWVVVGAVSALALLLATAAPLYAQDDEPEADASAIEEAADEGAASEPEAASEATDPTALCVYRSKNSGETYDPGVGDPEWDIPPGTPFAELPDAWTDSAGYPKSEYVMACDRNQ